MLLGESQRCFDSNSPYDAPALACFKDGKSTAEDAACDSEPSQCCWNDAEVDQEGESDSENNGSDAGVESCESAFLVDVALHVPKPERCIFEGVFAMKRIF